MSLTNYIGKDKLFEGAFLINLDSRPDRLFHSTNELKKVGIQDLVERLPAIQHRYGMVGCSLSHLECVKLAKQRGWKSVLIFEDDITIKPNFNEFYTRVLDQLSKRNWTVFHFGAMLMNICTQVDDNLLQVGYNWAAHAIAIHERAYDFIIEKYDWSYSETDSSKPWGGHYPFDGFINKNTFDAGFEIYSAYPLLISQTPGHSDTWGYHRDYKDLIEQSYRVQICSEVNVIIFSKNRPMQLHATLESYAKYARDSGSARINVLYTHDPQYEEGYNIVKKYFSNVNFVKEVKFSDDLKKLVEGRRYTFFIVDDTVFHAPFYVSDACDTLSLDKDVFSFSYRLGANTQYSYINNVCFERQKEYDSCESIIKLDWTKKLPYIDFGYPFEVSSSVYRSNDLLSILEDHSMNCSNPNYFELAGTTIVYTHKKHFGNLIATYRKSVAVSVPLNRVQHLHLNRCGIEPIYVPESLLRYYESGKILNFDNINEHWISNSVHVELKPEFKSR